MDKLITILIFCCLMPILSIEQDSSLVVKDSSNAIVIDAYGVSTGMTKAQLDKHKKDYVEKFKSISAKSGIRSTVVPLWQPKVMDFYDNFININKFEEMKNLGFDFLDYAYEFTRMDNENHKIKIAKAPIVVIATVVDATNIVLYEPLSRFQMKYTLKTEKILKNYLSTPISTIFDSYRGLRRYSPSGYSIWFPEFMPLKGMKVLCLLKPRTIYPPEFEKGKIVLKCPSGYENQNVYNGTMIPINNDRIKLVHNDKEEVFNITYLIKVIEEFNKINNKEDFYKQTWEISPPSLWEKIWYSIF